MICITGKTDSAVGNGSERITALCKGEKERLEKVMKKWRMNRDEERNDLHDGGER